MMIQALCGIAVYVLTAYGRMKLISTATKAGAKTHLNPINRSRHSPAGGPTLECIEFFDAHAVLLCDCLLCHLPLGF